MSRKPNLSLDLFGDRLCLPASADDGGEHARILRAMRQAARGELTRRQWDCLRMKYGEGKKVNEIAAELGVTPSTVSKHLKKARARIRRVLQYSFVRLEDQEVRPQNFAERGGSL